MNYLYTNEIDPKELKEKIKGYSQAILVVETGQYGGLLDYIFEVADSEDTVIILEPHLLTTETKHIILNAILKGDKKIVLYGVMGTSISDNIKKALEVITGLHNNKLVQIDTKNANLKQDGGKQTIKMPVINVTNHPINCMKPTEYLQKTISSFKSDFPDCELYSIIQPDCCAYGTDMSDGSFILLKGSCVSRTKVKENIQNIRNKYKRNLIDCVTNTNISFKNDKEAAAFVVGDMITNVEWAIAQRCPFCGGKLLKEGYTEFGNRRNYTCESCRKHSVF